MAKEKNFSNTDKAQPKKVRIELNDGSVYWLEEENIKKMFSNTPGAKKPNGDMTKVFSNYSNSTEEQSDKAKAEQDITLSDAIKIMHHNRSYMGVLMRRDSCWQNVFDGIDGKDRDCAKMVAEWADENSESSISFKQKKPEQYALIKKLVSDKTLDSSYVQMLRLYARVQNALKGNDDLLYVKHFINKIDLIDDDKLKYDIVHSVQSENSFRVRDAEITRVCATFCVNSPLASIEDFVAYQPFVAPSQMSQFCADAEKIVGDQIKSELSEIMPDFDKIQRSVNDLTRLVSMIEDSEISSAMKKRIRDNFDLKKLMAADAMEYIARGEQNTADQIRSLEKQLSDAQSRIATLETRLMNVTQERDAAQQNFDASVVHSNGLYDKYMKSAQDLQMLIDSASKMKSGLGSSGVKDYQALVQKIKANSRNN